MTCRRLIVGGVTKIGGKKMAGYRKLGRTSSQRKALIRGQVTSLLNNGKIVTTEARAKKLAKLLKDLLH